MKDHDGIKKIQKNLQQPGNSGQTFKLINRGRRVLKCIVGRRHRTTATEVTAELNQYLNSPVSTKTLL